MKRRKWTTEEEVYLYQKYFRQSVTKTAKKLNRTEQAIHNKASRLGLCYNYVNAQTIATCFNSDKDVVKRWIEKCDLKHAKMPYKFGYRYYIKVEDFWKWACLHKDEINWSKYELKSLLPEPEWVKEKKKTYQIGNSNKKITDMDIIRVRNMLRRGMTQKQIGLELGRSEYSIWYIKQKYIKHSKK